VASDGQIRADLESYFVEPFTDAQWKALQSHGYVSAISSGQRSVEDVARELQQLMALAGANPASEGPARAKKAEKGPLTWDEMERIVLARTLFGTKPAPSRTDPTVSAGTATAANAAGTSGPGVAQSKEPDTRPAPATGGAPTAAAAASGEGALGSRTKPGARGSRSKWELAGGIVLAAIVIGVLAYAYLANGAFSTPPDTSPPVTPPVVASSTAAPLTTGSSDPATTASFTTTSSTTSTSSTSTTASSTTTTASTTTTLADLTPTYTAELSGSNVVPPVSSVASGSLTLSVSADGSSVDYVLTVNDLVALTRARMRQGAVGETGAEIFTLYNGPTRTDTFTGIVSQGSFTAGELRGPLAGQTIADLLALIEAGFVYVNVGTAANPDGEIRGQLE
jgi:hypothetical protein